MKEACMSNHTNWPARFAEMLDLVGLSEAERQLIKASSALIMPHAGRLNDIVYEQLLQHPQSRKFFVTADDKPDAKRIEDNKQTMITWLRATATAPLNEGFVRYLVGVSQMHRNIPIHRPHLSPVAPRYIISTISFYQTAIAEILHQEMPDPALASRTTMAWNKWLIVGLELLLAGYLAHDGDD
jgi:hemoglobin-like flavoprotein